MRTLNLTDNKIENISFIPHPVLLHNYSRDDDIDYRKYLSKNSVAIKLSGNKINCSSRDCWVKDGFLKKWISTDVDLDCWETCPNSGIELMEILFLSLSLVLVF